MSFLTRTPGMTQREAREVCELHELIQHSLLHGPVPLERYVVVRRVNASGPLNAERNARRFVARLKSLGFLVEAEGDAEKLAIDFSLDEALRAEVERSIDGATALLAANNGVQHSEEEDDEDTESDEHPSDAVAHAHELGLDVRRLCRRFNVSPNKALLILRAKGVEPRDARPLRVEERRDVEVLRAALEAPKGYGYVTGVARALGCDRTTVYRILRRLKAHGPTASPRTDTP